MVIWVIDYVLCTRDLFDLNVELTIHYDLVGTQYNTLEL